MSTIEVDTDVLIVGAGPVGLFLANECVRRGLRCRLLETHASPTDQSKALAIFPRTLEILDMAGVVEPFLKVANRVTSVAVISDDRRLAQMPFTPAESPYTFIAMVPQNITERILAEQLQRQGGTIEYETSFLSALQQPDAVRVTIGRNGEQETLHARFVVGCDGAHSTVRHLLNLTFEGGQYDSLFMLADVQTNNALPSDELQLCPNERGPLAIFPMSGTRRRIVATVDRADGDAPSLELVQRILRERGPRAIEASAVHWSSYFRVHHRQVGHMRVGRMFVAGDAAHIHSPFGGQGMNTGLHDAWNLAWKLDLAVRGHGGEALLDSYTAERLPVIKHVIETTHLLTRAMGTSNTLAQTLRNAIIPIVSRLAPFQHAFVDRLSELGVAYRGSPIVEGTGERYFDDSLRGGHGIQSRFLLLFDAAADVGFSREVAELAASFPDVVDLRPGHHRGVTLVRPDGYIAYRSPSDASGAVVAARSLLERQVDEQDSAGR